MECGDGGGVVINKYLHKKFKKQTCIQPTSPPPPLSAPVLPAAADDDDALNNHVPSRKFCWPHSTNQTTTTKSSISCKRIDEQQHVEYATAGYHLVQQEALVLRNEHSDDDISQSSRIRNGDQQSSDVPSSTTSGGGGKYVCHFCNLACSKPSVLQKHIRAHTNERPYPCQSCNFSFKTRSNLYKHCRSRTHVNRVMGNRGGGQEDAAPTMSIVVPAAASEQCDRPTVIADTPHVDEMSRTNNKPYKPRFHTTTSYEPENEENSLAHSNERNADTIDYINDLIVRNRTIVNNCNYATTTFDGLPGGATATEEQPLNLTNKNRKRCMSEASSEPAKKSLIKELLLKNLYADRNMQCPHCKMIFRTFTELELHKMKMCKGRASGARYNRSSSVNVATILTQGKNSFEDLGQMTNMFPLKSPGPCLGKTRLVEADKSKSFSCDDSATGTSIRDVGHTLLSPYRCAELRYELPMFPANKGVKLFGGGEVKVANSSNSKQTSHLEDETYQNGHVNMDHKLRVVRSTLQSGGIVVHQQPPEKPSVNEPNDRQNTYLNGEYSNIMDFSQNAAKQLAPNLKQLNLTIPGISTASKFVESSPQPALLAIARAQHQKITPQVISNGDLANGPLNLLVNGKVVPYVPGMPGPVIAEAIRPKPIIQITPSPPEVVESESSNNHVDDAPQVISPPSSTSATLHARRRFKRPDSLALKPSATTLKHHHGLTPTMFNQILISPDTPRGDKKYNEQLIHGNYFSNLVLKSSTRPVYCTLNKTQPFYVPHFKKLSMYSEWRQQDNKSDKLYVSNYDSRQRNAKVTIAGKCKADITVHSSYECGNSDTGIVNPTCKLASRESHKDFGYSSRISDESSTRNQEHEAAYGLLSLSQKVPRRQETNNEQEAAKTTIGTLEVTNCSFINAEQLVHVSKTNYAKNKILDQNISLNAIKLTAETTNEPPVMSKENDGQNHIVGTLRPLTYPYTTPHTAIDDPSPVHVANNNDHHDDLRGGGEIAHFNVIKRYTPRSEQISPKNRADSTRKRRLSSVSETVEPPTPTVVVNAAEAIDLSVNEVRRTNTAPVSQRTNKNSDTTISSRAVGGGNVREYDISAMETLADLATKQEKLEKNSVAKNVATEFLKLATKHENKTDEKAYTPSAKGDLIVKSEENKNCTICNKSFSKPSQLRLHMNIHYLERPYRCESCSVSFRTKGHLQKHERSAGHNNKLSTSPALSSQEPRPFKCTDCSIAFRIHGHLAKHLRSKMHILKLECLSKIPFGLYAELERSNSLLTEINTADVEQCLESLKSLAKRIFVNDPKKLNQLTTDGSKRGAHAAIDVDSGS